MISHLLAFASGAAVCYLALVVVGYYRRKKMLEELKSQGSDTDEKEPVSENAVAVLGDGKTIEAN